MNLILFGPGARIPWRAHGVTLSQLSGIPLAVTLLLFISASTHAQYCVQWVQRTDVGTPGPRLGSAMAYDSDRGVTVLFGGEYHQSGNNDLFWDDTWEYDGIQWKPITIAGSKPQARDNHKMCYDTVRKQILLVGGRNENGLTRDAWVYYSTVPGVGTWVPMPYNGGGANFGFAFDESRGIAIVAGGIDQDVVSSDDTILWDGQQWTNVGTIGYSGINVHGLDDMAMAYDSSRQVVQYQGGRLRAPSSPPISPDDRGYYDTYEYSTGWHQSPLCYTADFNIMRYKHAMVYDRTRGRMVLFGGIPYGTSDADNIHGEYHPSFGWRSMNNFVATPPRRDRHVMVYDIRRGVTVLYGGVGNDNYNDTWELRPVTAAITLLDEPRQEHCEFENITLRTSVTTPSGSTLQWLHDGKPVPGANGVYLLLNSINSSHAGVYSLQVSDPCGNSVIGPPITLIVHTRPVITAFDNTRRARCPGDSVTFTVQSISTLPMTFQWWKVSPGNPIKIAGATQESLVLNNLTNTDTGEYYVEVANSCGSRYSSAGHLQVGPSILTQPQNASANACGEVSFSVLADGVGMLRYQWRLDGAALSNDVYFAGANSSFLHVGPLLYAHEGAYDVVISDDCGPANAVTSKVARLTIKPGPEWVLRATNGPSPRSGHAMAYDSARRVTVLFGGWQTNPAGEVVTLSDLWEWDGARWTLRVPHSQTNGWAPDGYQPSYSGQPVHRSQHNLVYDSARNRIVLFGGQSRWHGGFQLFHNDVWEWDGAQWHFGTTNGPVRRSNASMAYDSHRRVTVMTGGFLNGPSQNPMRGAVWEWDGVDWNVKVAPDGPATNYDQDAAAMAYDSFRRVILFGPTVSPFTANRWEFWTWNGARWNQFEDYSIPLWGLQYGDLTFDDYRRRSVWFGGQVTRPNSTGFFDGQQWEMLTTSPALPSGRYQQAMAYDASRHAVVMFGGETANFEFNGETWELIAVDQPLINEQPASQYRQAGTTASFTVTAVGAGALSYQWFRDGVRLSDDGRITGTATSTLTVADVWQADVGRYSALVLNDCGSTRSQMAVLTLDPKLQVFSAEKTLTLIWSDTAVILEQADSPAGPWVEVQGAGSPFHPSIFGPARFFRLRQTGP